MLGGEQYHGDEDAQQQAVPTGTRMLGSGQYRRDEGEEQQLPSHQGGGQRRGGRGKGQEHRGEDYPWTQLALFTAFNNKAVAIATGLINASDLHN